MCVASLEKITRLYNTLAGLVLTPLADLCLEPTLDRVDTPSATTRLACHEEYTIFFGEQCVRRFTCFACHVFDYPTALLNNPVVMVIGRVGLPMYRRKTFSTCFCWKRPLMTSRPAPSTLPVVPISENRNWITCSGCKEMRTLINSDRV